LKRITIFRSGFFFSAENTSSGVGIRIDKHLFILSIISFLLIENMLTACLHSS
jgi:hypothetical protein